MLACLGSPSLQKVAVAALLLTTSVSAQTYSSCNPVEGQTCPADPALGGSVSYELTSAPDKFTATGSPAYTSSGATFTVAKSGDAPQIASDWYIMFGKYEVSMKAAPGTGIVSAMILQSDDLDEIDWEFRGGYANEVQSNYFGQGKTDQTDRAATHAVTDTQNTFHTYAVEWTSSQIVWSIDGTTVRVLNYAAANGEYPQTPMQVKIGIWAAGDPSNPSGTISWAGGETDYSDGPFTMTVKSLTVTDYSTGTGYKYSGTSGTWQSIEAVDGTINGNEGAGSSTIVASPTITSTSSGGSPWTGTHKSMTTLSTVTSYPGLPSGWTVSSSGKVIPPSSGATSLPASSSASLSPSQSVSSSVSPETTTANNGAGYQTVTTFDQQGFPTTAVIYTGAKSYDDQGFLITPAATPAPTVAANVAVKKAVVDKAAENGAKRDAVGFLAAFGAAGLAVMAALL